MFASPPPTISLTCEGIVCALSKIAIDHCPCGRHSLSHRSVSESISGQGWVPETKDMREAA